MASIENLTVVVEKIFREFQSTCRPILSDACTTLVGVVLDAAPERLVCVGVLLAEVEAIDA